MFQGMKLDNLNLNDYATALRYWETCKPWRGETDEDDERPLKNRRVRNTGVRKLSDGRIVYRMHATQVVTYCPDGSLVLRIYNSITTAEFIRTVAPRHIQVSLSGRAAGNLTVGRAFPVKYYCAAHGDIIRISADDVVTPSSEWGYRVIDRKRANAVRKEYRLSELRNWLRAAQALRGGPTISPDNTCPRLHYMSDAELRTFTTNHENWPVLLAGGFQEAMSTLDWAEHSLIRRHATDAVTETSLDSYRDVERVRRAQRKWG